jgi:hypothetical protein
MGCTVAALRIASMEISGPPDRGERADRCRCSPAQSLQRISDEIVGRGRTIVEPNSDRRQDRAARQT